MEKLDLSAFMNPLTYGNVKGESKKAEKSRRKGGAGVFGAMLQEAAREEAGLGPLLDLPPSEEAIRALLDGVHTAGDALRERPFEEEMRAYKQAVRNFLHYVVENSYDIVQTQSMLRRKRNLKPHVQIRMVDQKLDELARGILSGQTTQMDLLSRLEEIKGLLVDFVVSGSIQGSSNG